MRLKKSLEALGNSQRLVFIIGVTLLFFIFVLQVSVLIYCIMTRNVLTGAIGGGVMLWPIIYWLRRLWIDNVIIEIARNALIDLPPDEAVKVIKIIYWGSFGEKRNRFGLSGKDNTGNS